MGQARSARPGRGAGVDATLTFPLFGLAHAIAGFFAILFTGRFPEGLFNAVTVAQRWSARTLLYAYFMTERYPPFTWA
ncbi:MAG TPA: DUF4389 domain-containing protein [Solirubrobacteraceae bacterium]|nr:DUF4389 domain-containing protein [Solirubrobacteraceae bacterium]